MPRGSSMFPSELFNDEGFRQLDDGPQRLFMWLWLHPDLNQAGVVAIQPREWASAAKNLSEAIIGDYAQVLRAQAWADYDDGQMWLRPFMSLDGALKSPSGFIAAARAVKTVRSRSLRWAIWEQFRNFSKPIAPMPDADQDPDGMKAKRAIGLNESVDRALLELSNTVSKPGVRESLSGAGGMPHPTPPRMGPVGGGVGAGDEGGVADASALCAVCGVNPARGGPVSWRPELCTTCVEAQKHPSMRRGAR